MDDTQSQQRPPMRREPDDVTRYRRQRLQRLVDAAGNETPALTYQSQRVLEWLSSLDDSVVASVGEVLHLTRAAQSQRLVAIVNRAVEQERWWPATYPSSLRFTTTEQMPLSAICQGRSWLRSGAGRGRHIISITDDLIRRRRWPSAR